MILDYMYKRLFSSTEYAFLHYNVQRMGFKENLKAELSYSGMLVKELAARSGIKNIR
jgi:hypothetical protein